MSRGATTRRAIFAILICLALAPQARAQAGVEPAVVLEVFVRSDCPHCTAAKAYLAELQRQRNDLQIVYRPVDQDPAARAELTERSRRAGLWPPGVPTFAVGDRLLVGFDTPQRSAPALVELIESMRARTRPASVETPLFGTLSVARLGLPLFTLALGLLDGFNPCAMWVLLFLLSLLVRLHDRRRMAVIAGTFVLTSGLVYYAFMAAWLNIFLAVGLTRPLRVLLAVIALAIALVNVKDFFAFGRGPSLSIPASAKPGIYARVRAVLHTETLTASLVAVTTLALLVNFVELLCTAGFPAIFTAVLTQQDLGTAAHYGYLGLYIVAYIFDDSLMVGAAVMTLGSHKLTEQGGRWLKLISGAVMLALGATLLLKPDWLI